MENNTYNQDSKDNNNYGEQGNYQLDLEPAVTMGEWLTSLLILIVPCVNIVMMFIWAFSKTEKKSKSNFFKAQLIFSLIMMVISFLFLVIFGVGAIGAIGSVM